MLRSTLCTHLAPSSSSPSNVYHVSSRISSICIGTFSPEPSENSMSIFIRELSELEIASPAIDPSSPSIV